MEPVIRSFLMIRVALVRLALKPSFVKDLNGATGVRPCLSRTLIQVLVYSDTLGKMSNSRAI